MKQYARHRLPHELRPLIHRRQWRMNTLRYDAGGDYVTIHFGPHGIAGELCYNTFNGKFFGKLYAQRGENGYPERDFNERSTELDKEPWYEELLKVLYVPLKKEVKKV